MRKQILVLRSQFVIFVTLTKHNDHFRNPLYRWSIGRGPIHEVSFSPCGHFLATVSQDGHLRIFNYDSMELVGFARCDSI